MVIGRSTPDVFAYTTDLHNHPQWDVEVDEVQNPHDAEPESGARWPVRFVPFRGESVGTLTVTDLALQKRLVLEADFAGMLTTITYLYSSEPAGTRFTREVKTRGVKVRPPGMLKLMTPFVAWRVKHASRRDLVNLKRVLEGL